MNKCGIEIYQIYYDAASRAKVLPGFVPLDNSRNARPDWYEFWVILNFLKATDLKSDTWYGFFSPKFREKTGFDDRFVLAGLERYGNESDVAIFSPDWDQLAYFLNPWEQGEVWCPGLTVLSQKFLQSIGFSGDLRRLVTDATTSVLCNYVVAKSDFWRAWLAIAEYFFDIVERENASARVYSVETFYGSKSVLAPMKTFIQERFACYLLATRNFRVLTPGQSFHTQVFTRLFRDSQDQAVFGAMRSAKVTISRNG